MSSQPCPDKGIYVELPLALLAALDKRCRQTGWSRKAQLVRAVQQLLEQPPFYNPIKHPNK